jgi:hypothetical protein
MRGDAHGWGVVMGVGVGAAHRGSSTCVLLSRHRKTPTCVGELFIFIVRGECYRLGHSLAQQGDTHPMHDS